MIGKRNIKPMEEGPEPMKFISNWSPQKKKKKMKLCDDGNQEFKLDEYFS